MKTKLISAIAAAAVSLCIGVSSNAQIPASNPMSFGEMSFGTYHITSIVPTSFTSIDGTINLTVTDNPYGRITVSDISGVIYKQGTAFIIGKADDLVIPAGRSSINVNGHICLESTQALLTVLRNPSINPADYSADIKATIKVKGRTVIVEKQNLPLSRILK